MKNSIFVLLVLSILFGLMYYIYATEPTLETEEANAFRDEFYQYCSKHWDNDPYQFCPSGNFRGFMQEYHNEDYERLKEVIR